MADFQAEIPQRIEHRLDHLLGPGRLFAGSQEADINVGIGGHFTAPIAADRDDRDTLGRGRIAHRIQALDGEIVEQAEQLVDQEGLARRCLQPARRMFDQPPPDLGTPCVERLLEQGGCRVPQSVAIPLERGERIGDGAPIDDRTALREGFKAWRHAFQIGGRAIRVHAGCA